MSPRRNWDSPNPSLASEYAPPPRNGRGQTRLRVRGWGSPNSDDLRKSLALCLLCASKPLYHATVLYLCMVTGITERESIITVQFINKYSQKYTALFSNMSSAWQHDLNVNAGIIARGFHTVKKLSFLPSLLGMSLTKLSLAGNNLIIPIQGEFG